MLGFVGPKDNRTGQIVAVKAVKNKCAPPFRTAQTAIIYGKGISRYADILILAVEEGIVEKKGAYYYYNDENVAHGQQNGETWVAQHPEIEKAVREKVFGNGAEPELVQEKATEALELLKSLSE